jgi:integrase
VSENYLTHLRRFSFKKFKNHFGGKYLVKNISRQKFEDYLRKIDLNISSKNHIIRTSKLFFNTLIEKGHLPLNPIAKLSYIPLARVEDYEILTVSQVRKILTQSLNEEDYSMLAVLLLVLYCGVRIGKGPG